MQFNSFSYILIFLPFVFLVYFSLAKYTQPVFAKVFLILASFFFYGWWSPAYLPLLFLSILANYTIVYFLKKQTKKTLKNCFLIAGISFNILLLAYFKYVNFFIENINVLLGSHFVLDKIILPLGISFFTFTQIAFLVDAYHGKTKQDGILNYFLFVSYFPHLLAGPIIHHAQMMPQFENEHNTKINYKNIYFGLVLFVIGLTKKVVIADTFAIIANRGYSNTAHLEIVTAWVMSLAYTFQIYFDFSGYTDMAIGASKLFNIDLPINFNSPYQSLNIKEFWRRWHITLSHFLRDYLYVPLGGNRVSELKIYRNLLVTFILGGLWHGAGWTFIIWGMLHGAALSVHRWFSALRIQLPKWLGWFITFNFINITWVFFRADSFHQAIQVVSAMFDSLTITSMNPVIISLLSLALLITITVPNSCKVIETSFAGKLMFIPVISMLMLISVIAMEISHSHEFIYFHF